MYYKNIYILTCKHSLGDVRAMCVEKTATHEQITAVLAKTRVRPMTENDVAYPKDDASGSSRWSPGAEAKPMTGANRRAGRQTGKQAGRQAECRKEGAIGISVDHSGSLD